MPSAHRANDALLLAVIKSTRLVTNANRLKAAFPVSPYTLPWGMTRRVLMGLFLYYINSGISSE